MQPAGISSAAKALDSSRRPFKLVKFGLPTAVAARVNQPCPVGWQEVLLCQRCIEVAALQQPGGGHLGHGGGEP
eukprot:10300721-Alexandrium_andersonii.AAC.1